MVKQQHLDFAPFAVSQSYDAAAVGSQDKSPRAHGLGVRVVPFLDLLLPVGKEAQYIHLGYAHMAEINARLLKKEVKWNSTTWRTIIQSKIQSPNGIR